MLANQILIGQTFLSIQLRSEEFFLLVCLTCRIKGQGKLSAPLLIGPSQPRHDREWYQPLAHWPQMESGSVGGKWWAGKKQVWQQYGEELWKWLIDIFSALLVAISVVNLAILMRENPWKSTALYADSIALIWTCVNRICAKMGEGGRVSHDLWLDVFLSCGYSEFQTTSATCQDLFFPFQCFVLNKPVSCHAEHLSLYSCYIIFINKLNGRLWSAFSGDVVHSAASSCNMSKSE